MVENKCVTTGKSTKWHALRMLLPIKIMIYSRKFNDCQVFVIHWVRNDSYKSIYTIFFIIHFFIPDNHYSEVCFISSKQSYLSFLLFIVCKVYLTLSYFFFFISWRVITLQYCSGFCHTLKWISHGFTCVPHPDPASL